MAVLNIRVDDRIRDQLKEAADNQGVTLSEYVRNLVMEAVVPIRDRALRGDEPPQESLPIFERQVLSLLHRVLGRVLPEDANDDDGTIEDQLARARVLEAGYAGEYWLETAGFQSELSQLDCGRVQDILDMFRVLTFNLERLERHDGPIDEELKLRLEFKGFDHNNPLEAHMASYVEYLMSEDRWTELRPQLARNDGGNSHGQMLDIYMRMVAQYRRIIEGRGRGYGRMDYVLSLGELRQVADAAIRPPWRGSSAHE